MEFLTIIICDYPIFWISSSILCYFGKKHAFSKNAFSKNAFSKNAFFKKCIFQKMHFSKILQIFGGLVLGCIKYQNEILQQNMRLTAFFKLYKICILLHRCNLKIFAKNRFEKLRISQNSEKFRKFLILANSQFWQFFEKM